MPTSHKSLFITLSLQLSVFTATPALAHDLEVVVAGNTGSCTDPSQCPQYAVAREMLRVCVGAGCDMAILAGDLVHHQGGNEHSHLPGREFDVAIGTPYSPLAQSDPDFKVLLAVGERDVANPAYSDEEQLGFLQSYVEDRPVFKFPSPSYSYRATDADVEFFVADTEHFDREQFNELRRALRDSTAEWKVVVAHQSPHNNVRPDKYTEEATAELLPIVCQQADLLVTGDNDRLSAFMLDCGVPMVVSGAGGETNANDWGGAREFWHWAGKNRYGFVRLLFDEDQLTTRFYGGEWTGPDEDFHASLLKSIEFPRHQLRTPHQPPTLPVQIVGKAHQRCLHASQQSKVGDQFDIYRGQCSDKNSGGSSSNLYTFVPSQKFFPGAYKIVSELDDNKCVHASQSQLVEDHKNLYYRPCAGGHPGQYFDLIPSGDGHWYLKNRAYTTCIHVSNTIKNADGHPAIYHTRCQNTDKQRFKLEYRRRADHQLDGANAEEILLDSSGRGAQTLEVNTWPGMDNPWWTANVRILLNHANHPIPAMTITVNGTAYHYGGGWFGSIDIPDAGPYEIEIDASPGPFLFSIGH